MNFPRDIANEIHTYNPTPEARKRLDVDTADLLEMLAREVEDIDSFLEQQLIDITRRKRIHPTSEELYRILKDYAWRVLGDDTRASIYIEDTLGDDDIQVDTLIATIKRVLPRTEVIPGFAGDILVIRNIPAAIAEDLFLLSRDERYTESTREYFRSVQ